MVCGSSNTSGISKYNKSSKCLSLEFKFFWSLGGTSKFIVGFITSKALLLLSGTTFAVDFGEGSVSVEFFLENFETDSGGFSEGCSILLLAFSFFFFFG